MCCSNYCVHIRLFASHIDDFTTVPYIGDYSTAYRMFRTTALSDDGPVRSETFRSFVN